jgi:hypothetical protein
MQNFPTKNLVTEMELFEPALYRQFKNNTDRIRFSLLGWRLNDFYLIKEGDELWTR